MTVYVVSNSEGRIYGVCSTKQGAEDLRLSSQRVLDFSGSYVIVTIKEFKLQ